MNPLIRLKEFGQSIWYDNIRRALITSGEFDRMITEQGVTGVTSNPVIFEKAISGAEEYDEDIEKYKKAGLDNASIINELMTEDIRLAADALKGVYNASGGVDGYVSIEVSPLLAHDAEGTVAEAKQLHSMVDRSNLLVKVPATVEGLKAIEELVYEGYNINATLLFSVTRYEEVARAYLRALERRLDEGKPVDKAFGVASFFVSRVDSLVDSIIEERVERSSSNDEKARLHELAGKTAVANAKLAYARYKEVFEGPAFDRVLNAGGRPQRLLWGSTGTKNPLYSDVKYVEELIEKNTINTMPLPTLMAFADHGHVAATLATGLDEAQKTIDAMGELGIDYDEVTHKLEEDGVKGFADGFASLTECIAGKAASLLEHEVTASYELHDAATVVAGALEKFEDEKFSERLWAKDATLWKDKIEEKRLIKGMLGWLQLPRMMPSHVEEINAFTADVRGSGFTDVVLLGMGGSSLAPLVLAETFGAAPGYPRLRVCDTTDPDAVASLTDTIDPVNTLFIVSSKSGSTIEPLSLFEYFYELLHARSGKEAGKNFVAITDPGTPLEGFSRKYRFRRLFLNPSDIGGRFSALSFFGLVPAALAGIDISKLLSYAEQIEEAAQPCVHAAENPSLKLGAAMGVLARSGRDKLTIMLSKEVSTFGLWIEQLVAESTGKEGTGIVPVAGEPLGNVSDYGADRTFVYIGLGEPEKETGELLDSLAQAGHPVIRFRLKDLHELGAEFLRWEIATAAAGEILGINPFDQPDVELAKRLTMSLLNDSEAGAAPPAQPGLKPGGPAIEKANVTFGKAASEMLESAGKSGGGAAAALSAFLSSAAKGDYVGVLAYYDPFDTELAGYFVELRKSLRKLTGAAVQFGYGPRYLHSTGQLHKGGANKGVFLMLTHAAAVDIEIPKSHFGFSSLELSQAYGDMEALDSKGCRVAMVTLADSSPATLQAALKTLAGVAAGG